MFYYCAKFYMYIPHTGKYIQANNSERHPTYITDFSVSFFAGKYLKLLKSRCQTVSIDYPNMTGCLFISMLSLVIFTSTSK